MLKLNRCTSMFGLDVVVTPRIRSFMPGVSWLGGRTHDAKIHQSFLAHMRVFAEHKKTNVKKQ